MIVADTERHGCLFRAGLAYEPRDDGLFEFSPDEDFDVDGIHYIYGVADVYVTRPMFELLPDGCGARAQIAYTPSDPPSEPELDHWVATGYWPTPKFHHLLHS